MDGEQDLDLQDLVAELAADLKDASATGDGGVMVYRRGEPSSRALQPIPWSCVCPKTSLRLP